MSDSCPVITIRRIGKHVHGKVDRGVKAQAALVRAQGRVELNAVAAVDAQVALVVLPDDAELDDALRDGADLESGAVLGVLLEEGAVLESAGELWKRASQQSSVSGVRENRDQPLYACWNSGSAGSCDMLSATWSLMCIGMVGGGESGGKGWLCGRRERLLFYSGTESKTSMLAGGGTG